MSRVFEKYEDRVAINFAFLTLFKFTFGTLLISHWIGCLWYITSYIENVTPSWVSVTGVGEISSLSDASTYDVYVASWYS